jgi:uncharacterized protein YbjT (DUF2867 family)
VEKLARAGANVRALVHTARPQDRAPGVKYVEGDYQDKESLLRACQGVDWVIACVGAQSAFRGLDLIEKVEYQGTVNMVDAAKAQGVRHMSLISVRAADTKWDFYPVYPAKAKADQRLMESGLSFTLFRPGGMIDTSGAVFKPMIERVKKGETITIYGSPDQPMAYIFLDELADFLIHSHLTPRARNRVFELGGPNNPTRAEFWAFVGEVVGKEPKVVYKSPDELVPQRREAEKAKDWPRAHGFAREEISGRIENPMPPMQVLDRLFQVKQRDFRQWLLGVLRREAAATPV